MENIDQNNGNLEIEAKKIAEMKVRMPAQRPLEYSSYAFGIAFVVCGIFEIVSMALGHSVWSSENDEVSNIALPITAVIFAIIAYWKNARDWREYEEIKKEFYEQALWNLKHNDMER